MAVSIPNNLGCYDRAMVRRICNVKKKDEISSGSLVSNLGIQVMDVVLHTRRMVWFWHVECSKGTIAKIRKLNLIAHKRTWDEMLMKESS